MRTRESWKPRVLRRFGRLLATAFVLLYGVLLIGEGFEELGAEGAALVAILVYTAMSIVTAWLNDWVGGAMLVVASVALASFVAIAAERNPVIAAALFGGPFLLSGAALLLASALHEQWRDEQEGCRQ